MCANGQVTSGEQQHARSRGHTLGGPNRSITAAASDSEKQVDTESSADSEFLGAASAIALPAFLAALVATSWSGRHNNDTTAAVASVVTSIAAVPVAIGTASGLGCLWQQCFSDAARALWSKARASKTREKEADLTPSFVVLCQMGIEDIVEQEIVTRLQEQSGLDGSTSRSLILKQGIRGLVMVASGGDDTESVLLGLRTANYVLAYHCW